MTARARTQQRSDLSKYYKEFDQLDGSHPWMKVVPEGFVSYRVQELQSGKVVYFNFSLAKEMGLIPKSHEHQMTSSLEEKLLETFSIQIINEYDELSKKRIPQDQIKKNRFMATRYLQLQHDNKKGTTSGDGRGIWNGIVENKGQIWDVSSRGTGVTCLAPGAVAAQKPLKTGGTDFGYGCGQAEIDELIGSAIMAESFHLQGISTERVLCVIDLGKGVGIGVRAANNLIRPAHLFLYLKQNRLDMLKKAFDYLIDRQIKNKSWTIETKNSSTAKIYEQALKQIAISFGKFAAKLENEYVFAWLDWDGDNVLADAGIIDYGSVRQFGLRHDQYRYDDIERFSTNLKEQKNKAKILVQVFAQMTEALNSGHKKALPSFKNHWAVKLYNQTFTQSLNEGLLYKMGFDQAQREQILKSNKTTFEQFEKVYRWIESKKISGQMARVPDGVNHPALYNLRHFLKEMPLLLLQGSSITATEIHKKILSGFAKRKDFKLSQRHKSSLENLIQLYSKLVFSLKTDVKQDTFLRGLYLRSEKLNSDGRITGNALIQIVDKILEEKKKGLSATDLQSLIDQLVYQHVGFPEVQIHETYEKSNYKPKTKKKVYSELLSLVQEHKEDI